MAGIIVLSHLPSFIAGESGPYGKIVGGGVNGFPDAEKEYS
jgi:hypothetical protein